MLAGVPAAERRVELARASTALLEAGDGPPLVLLHGGIECGGAYWAPVIGRLAESHRLVVPDLPGLGESEPLADLPDGFADWLRALLDATCDERPMVIAHSLVGALTARYATRDTGAIRELVIYAAPGIGPYRIPLRLMVLAARFDLRPTEKNAERFDRFAFFDFDGARRRDGEWLAAWSLYIRERGRCRTLRARCGG